MRPEWVVRSQTDLQLCAPWNPLGQRSRLCFQSAGSQLHPRKALALGRTKGAKTHNRWQRQGQRSSVQFLSSLNTWTIFHLKSSVLLSEILFPPNHRKLLMHTHTSMCTVSVCRHTNIQPLTRTQLLKHPKLHALVRSVRSSCPSPKGFDEIMPHI